MQLNQSTHKHSGLSACGLATVLLCASLAVAKSYDIVIDTSQLVAQAIEQSAPAFPDDDSLRKGQEGWVQLNFVVSPDGSAADPIVVDSTGGESFEKAALDAVGSWQFQASEAGISNNSVAIRFQHSDDSGRASRNFSRWYKIVLRDLASEKNDKARENLERAKAFGGWNLYESTILSILEARVADAEGDDKLRLQSLRRALRMGDETALNAKTRRELLTSLVKLELRQQHFAAAQQSLELLRATEGSDKTLASLSEEIAQLEARLSEAVPVSVAASIAPVCGCESGDSVWAHTPLMRSFAFEDIEGELARFEARCDKHRLSGEIVSEKAWSIPDDWGHCEVFVFGDDGASFNFVELPADEDETGPEEIVAAHKGVD